MSLCLVPKNRKTFDTEATARYKEEKEAIRKDADTLAAESRDWDKASDGEMHLSSLLGTGQHGTTNCHLAGGRRDAQRGLLNIAT